MKHPGFKSVQSTIARKEGISKARAGAILASASRRASRGAVRANPRLLSDIVYVTNPKQRKLSGRDRPVKLTAAMIAAGSEWLDRYDPDYSDSAKYLTNIFRAMQMARVHSAKTMKGKE